MLNTILPQSNYRLHAGILLAVLCAVSVHYFLYRTRFGFEIRSVGLNSGTAKVQGISIAGNTYISLMFSGFLAGLAGTVQVLGLNHKMFLNLSGGYGWNGIAVALLAFNNPLSVIFTAILWGALDAGGQYMVRVTDTPNSIVEIIKAVILFLIVAKYLYFRWGELISSIFYSKQIGVKQIQQQETL